MNAGARKAVFWTCAFLIAAAVPGCAGREFAPKRQVMWYHSELPAADRAVEAARQAGKDKECPAEFQAAEKMKNDAYDIYLACRTQEGIAMANEATARAKGLCGKKAPPPPAAAKPKPPPPPPPAAPARKVVDRLTLHINFDTDKADIRDADSGEMQKAVAFVKKHPDAKISVEGFTDDRGSDEHNLKLSERRAQAVKKYIEEKGGVKADRITAVGKGKADPIGDNATEAGRFQNRRVELVIVGD